MHNSDPDESLKDFNEKRLIHENMQTLEEALNEINSYTKNDVKCIEECVKYVKYLYDSSKKQPRSLNLRSQYDLQEEIADLKDKLKSNERKFIKKLEKKDSEIKELKEELESLEKVRSSKDSKELKDKNSELENELNEKINACATFERKIKDLRKKINSLTEENETLSEKFEDDERQMKKEIIKLKDTISSKHNEVENEIAEYVKRLAEKQCAIDTIKKKMLSKNDTIVVLEEKLSQSVVELDEYKSQLKDLKERNSELQNNLKDKNNVYEQLEMKLEYLTRDNISLTEENKTLSKELEKSKAQMRKELEERISTVQNASIELKKKQCAIDTIKEKLLLKTNENDLLDGKLTKIAVEFDDCRKDLEKEKLRSEKYKRALSLHRKENRLVNNFQN